MCFEQESHFKIVCHFSQGFFHLALKTSSWNSLNSLKVHKISLLTDWLWMQLDQTADLYLQTTAFTLKFSI